MRCAIRARWMAMALPLLSWVRVSIKCILGNTRVEQHDANIEQRHVRHFGLGLNDVDLVLADPPYDFDGWVDLITSVRADTVIAESGASLPDVPGWTAWRSKRYSRTWVTFLERER